ncbi:hypothetical protein, partial [Ornithinibacter aureus]
FSCPDTPPQPTTTLPIGGSRLRRALEESLEVGRRISAEQTTNRTAYRFHLGAWLTAAHRIHGLLKGETGHAATPFMHALEDVRAEMLVARSALDEAGSWRTYNRHVLRSVLEPYADEAEAMIVAGDNRLVDKDVK